MTEDRDWRARVTYRRPDGSKDDEETILDFVNEHFVPFEPLNVAINMCEKGYRSVTCVLHAIHTSRRLK